MVTSCKMIVYHVYTAYDNTIAEADSLVSSPEEKRAELLIRLALMLPSSRNQALLLPDIFTHACLYS